MERRRVIVEGIVQGVGFRPFVYAVAVRLGLKGFVHNRAGDVHLEIEGEPCALDRFIEELKRHPPVLSRVERVAVERCPVRGDKTFRIAASGAEENASSIFVSPDAATCRDCVAELFDPANRRYRYPFINCTNCGPRLTIVTGAPYDRARTTMASFAMCDACRGEYENPADRRFHAQPVCCAACGPRLMLCDAQGQPRHEGEDALAGFIAAMREGKIGALKGLGGYHLVCDAGNAAAVAQLRRRKQREEKPFAVMFADVEAIERDCEVGAAERELLTSAQAPIVLVKKREGIEERYAGVAPGNPMLGVMLPYTPLHHLLLPPGSAPGSAAGSPALGSAAGDLGTPQAELAVWHPSSLVMTSGNRSDEPIAYDDGDALERLAGIADVFLLHDRPIRVRCDDSVMRVVEGAVLPLRRSRGEAPRPVRLPMECAEATLAVGGQLKATFALVHGRQAFLSQHLGDLDHFEAARAFERDVMLYEQLVAIWPRVLAHDPHPDYASTRYAKQRAAAEGLRLEGVQHHQAHVASCMAEHGLTEPVIGLAFDGTGYGEDGAIWGGEVFVGEYATFRRAAHLRYVGMPGGEQAVREPWRMALAHLVDAGVEGRVTFDVGDAERQVVRQMIERRFNTPRTSSVGRLFDAVASLIGVRDRVSYEGQAAIELEWLAMRAAADGAYPMGIEGGEAAGECRMSDFGCRMAGTSDIRHSRFEIRDLIIDTRPLIREVARDAALGVSPAVMAGRFHAGLAEAAARVCERLRQATGIAAVVLSGGVFANGVLTEMLTKKLRAMDFQVYRHRQVPPGDGGLCLGQAAIAAARLHHGDTEARRGRQGDKEKRRQGEGVMG